MAGAKRVLFDLNSILADADPREAGVNMHDVPLQLRGIVGAYPTLFD